MGDVVTVFNNEEVPADIVLINVDQSSAFFDTIALDGEPVLAERFAPAENITTSAVQSYRGLIMCEAYNPVIHKFKGAISVDNKDFVDLDERNFAMRGSTLKNTAFIIGIVVYVGTDTKAH